MEIVSEPDIRTPDEAGMYISKIRSILMYLDTCDGNMQEGSLRADVNISVRKPGDEYGTRCEIKNLNSCLLYTSPSPRDKTPSRMPSSA